MKQWSDTAIFRLRHARLWDWKVTPQCRWVGAKWQGWLSLFYHRHTCLHACIPHSMHIHMHAKTDYINTQSHILYKKQQSHTHCNSLLQNASGRYTSDKLCMVNLTRVRITVGVLGSLHTPIYPPGFNVTQYPVASVWGYVKWTTPHRNWQECQIVLTWDFLSLSVTDTLIACEEGTLKDVLMFTHTHGEAHTPTLSLFITN